MVSLDGFHLTGPGDKVGARVSADSIERARPIDRGQRRMWAYPVDLSDVGIDDLYPSVGRLFYSVADLCTIMDKSHNIVRELAKKHGWRKRTDMRFNTKEYYLYDILVTVWSNVESWPGQKLDTGLLNEARGYNMGIG